MERTLLKRKPGAFAAQHASLTRRYFLQLGGAGLAAIGASELWAKQVSDEVLGNPVLSAAVSELEYLTPVAKFKAPQRPGKMPLSEAPAANQSALDRMRETWKLEVMPDPESDSKMHNPLTTAKGNALDWAGLMKLAEKHAVRFLHVMTCTHMPQPDGMGLWEGVPMRDILWLTEPKENIRRIVFVGDHNDQPFQGSLPINRVLEELPGELPVIVCYKLNDLPIPKAKGGPVRLVVPGGYGNRSIKWLQRILLTNSYKASDTYALRNNDVESPLKTCARFIRTPESVKAGQPFALTGLAQVGLSGLKQVQYWLKSAATPMPESDPYLSKGDWQDAIILPPPEKWGCDLPDGKLPPVMQVDPKTGRPFTWPIPNTIVHWAALAKVAAPGKYELRCRTVDANGIAQPMPRPFGNSGFNRVDLVEFKAEA